MEQKNKMIDFFKKFTSQFPITKYELAKTINNNINQITIDDYTPMYIPRTINRGDTIFIRDNETIIGGIMQDNTTIITFDGKKINFHTKNIIYVFKTIYLSITEDKHIEPEWPQFEKYDLFNDEKNYKLTEEEIKLLNDALKRVWKNFKEFKDDDKRIISLLEVTQFESKDIMVSMIDSLRILEKADSITSLKFKWKFDVKIIQPEKYDIALGLTAFSKNEYSVTEANITINTRIAFLLLYAFTKKKEMTEQEQGKWVNFFRTKAFGEFTPDEKKTVWILFEKTLYHEFCHLLIHLNDKYEIPKPEDTNESKEDGERFEGLAYFDDKENCFYIYNKNKKKGNMGLNINKFLSIFEKGEMKKFEEIKFEDDEKDKINFPNSALSDKMPIYKGLPFE